MTLKKFYAYQVYLKDKMTDFKGKDLIKGLVTAWDDQCACFDEEEQKLCNKMTRILIKEYLQKNLLNDILSSNRVCPKNIKDYLKGKRILE